MAAIAAMAPIVLALMFFLLVKKGLLGKRVLRPDRSKAAGHSASGRRPELQKKIVITGNFCGLALVRCHPISTPAIWINDRSPARSEICLAL
jgi:hypothetical protein